MRSSAGDLSGYLTSNFSTTSPRCCGKPSLMTRPPSLSSTRCYGAPEDDHDRRWIGFALASYVQDLVKRTPAPDRGMCRPAGSAKGSRKLTREPADAVPRSPGGPARDHPG
jgi:hypothetical protein